MATLDKGKKEKYEKSILALSRVDVKKADSENELHNTFENNAQLPG